ncbi:MAG: chorismate-binding protein [Gelidibacter sp.]
MTLDDFFECLNQQFQSNLPVVAYRAPDAIEVKAFLQDSETLYKTSEFTESGFVFAPFDNLEDAVLIPLEHSEIITCHFENTDKITASKIKKASQASDKKDHIQLVKKGIKAINQQQLRKVVLSRSETIPLLETNPIHTFKQLLQIYPTAFVYCWFHPKIGLWLGATPETLLKTEGNRLSTMALAGTQKYNGTLDVVWKDKEKEEQQIVTDFIVGSIQSSDNTIEVSNTKTVRAGNLLHLKTSIKINFKPETLNLKQLLLTLHPTPAICGFPKDKAKQFILKNESYKREFYSGFLGELHLKEKTNRNPRRRNIENSAYSTVKTVSNLYVNLRCMQLKANNAIIYVGGGITKDSNPEAEWEETVHKSMVMKSVL